MSQTAIEIVKSLQNSRNLSEICGGDRYSLKNSTLRQRRIGNIEFKVETTLEVANRGRTGEIYVEPATVVDTRSKMSNSTSERR